MSNTQPAFTASDGMKVIESMIAQAKNRFSENGFLYLLWGWTVFVCSLGQFVLERAGYQQHYYVWGLTWLAVIIQFVYLARQKKVVRVKTYTDDVIKYVWIVFVVLMAWVGFLLGHILEPAQLVYVNVFILVLYGMPTVLSGVLLRFKPLVIGGVICWLLVLISLFIPVVYYPLLITLAVAAAWIIPGYLLRARYKKSHAN